MRKCTVLGVALALWLIGAWAHADSLPIAGNLIDIRTTQGEQLLRRSEDFDSYVRLSINFVTERTKAMCGIASAAMVLNALGVLPPDSPEYAPYRMFDQNNLLDKRSEQIVTPEVLERQGMTLDQVGRLLALYPLEQEVRHAGDSSPDEFRTLARKHLGGAEQAVIVNYLRSAINQERGGHFSPLGAYDAGTDRFLILDVARYKYPPVWVKTSELFAAMNTVDAKNSGQTRGFILIRKGPEPPSSAPR